MSAPTGYEHIARFYDEPKELVIELAEQIDRDLAEGGAVLVRLPPALSADLAAIAPSDPLVQYLDAADGYSRPIDALHAVWAFTMSSRRSEIEYVHAIGEIAFHGDRRDRDWYWYEAATNVVLADQPLRATCTYSTRLPAPVLDGAHRTHPLVCSGSECVPSPAFDPTPGSFTPEPVALPARRPDIESRLTDLRSIRQVLAPASPRVPEALLQRGRLVLTELVTNAIRHGGGVAEVSVWGDPERLVFRITDHGAGGCDEYATLHPPSLPARGAGLWISHLESSRMILDSPIGGGTTVDVLID